MRPILFISLRRKRKEKRRTDLFLPRADSALPRPPSSDLAELYTPPTHPSDPEVDSPAASFHTAGDSPQSFFTTPLQGPAPSTAPTSPADSPSVGRIKSVVAGGKGAEEFPPLAAGAASPSTSTSTGLGIDTAVSPSKEATSSPSPSKKQKQKERSKKNRQKKKLAERRKSTEGEEGERKVGGIGEEGEAMGL